MHKIFSFKGVTRSCDNLLAGDGECIAAVNVRAKDGLLVPLPVPSDEAVLEYGYSMIFWHEATRHYLCVTDDSDATLHLYDIKWERVLDEAGEPVLFDGLCGIRNVEFQGYVVCCLSSKGIIYLLYNDGKYRFLGERPSMPELEINVNSKLSRTITECTFAGTSGDDFESTWRYNAKGFFDEAISTLNESGHYIDRALFKFALRAFDGSYIAISPAIYVCDEGRVNGVSRDTYNLYATATGSLPSTYDVSVLGFKPEFRFSQIDLADWKNIVVGIDIFTTGSIMGKKVERLKWRKRTTASSCVYVDYEAYVDKSFDELCADVADASHYYRIAEYDIEGELIEALEDVSQTSLVLQRSLENDDCHYSSIVPGCSYMFNNRLHVGALKEFFCKGYDPVFLKGPHGEKHTMESMIIKTKIKTLKGTSVVVREYKDIDLMYNNGRYELSPLLSYPDTRAFEMSVYLTGGEGLFCKTFPLTPHRYLNQSQFLNRWSLGFKVSYKAVLSGSAKIIQLRDKDIVEAFAYQTGTHELVYSKSEASWMYNGIPSSIEEIIHSKLVQNWSSLADGDYIAFTITTSDDSSCFHDICNIPFDDTWTLLDGQVDFNDHEPYEERGNLLKVSAVDNVFSFPANCTYTPTQGKIIALSSNTVALSQGQYGQYPLYVFCSDGVWAMSVDTSGATAYLASSPLSRQVCINRNSVCGIDNGTVFVSQQGVVLLSGGKMKKLSASMEGESGLPGRIACDSVIERIFTMMGLPNFMGNEEFCRFISDASVAYLPSHDEIMLANPEFDYCYVYSLQYAVWTQVAINVGGFVKSNSFSKMFSSTGLVCKVQRWSDAISGNNRVLLVTRPQLWGTKLPKRIVQLMLHGYSKPVENKTQWIPSLACYMFGSNDGVNFCLIAGRETEQEVKDLKFPYYPTQSYRYYIFAVCGELSATSWITGMEFEVEPAWNSRLC